MATKTQYLGLTAPQLADQVGSTIPALATNMSVIDAEFGQRGVNVKWFGAKGDGVTNDTAAIQNALNACPDGGIVYFGGGTNKYAVSNLTVSGKSIILDGGGSTLVQNTNNPIFTYTGGWVFTESVTSITTTTIDLSQGDSAITTVSMLTLANDHSSQLAQGDIVEVYSSDTMSDGATTFKEFAVVGSVSGRNVYLTAPLRMTYTNNVVMRKLQDSVFHMRNFVFDTNNPTWNSTIVNIYYAKSPTCEKLKVIKGGSAFLNFFECYGYEAKDLVVNNLTNNHANGNFGYGVNDNASEGGTIISSHFINCRHGITTNDVTRNLTVSDCHAIGCSNAGFDSHKFARGITYNHCTAVGVYQGSSSSGAGFQARGQNIRFNNCFADACNIGWNFFDTDVNDIELNDCKATNITSYPLYVPGQSQYVLIKVRDSYFETLTSTYSLQLQNVDIRIVNSDLVSKTSASYSNVINLTSSKCDLNNVRIDLSNATGTNMRFITVNSGSSVTGRFIQFIRGTANINNMLTGDNSTGTSVTLYQSTIDVGSVTNVYNIQNYSLDLTALDGTYTTMHFTQSVGGNGTALTSKIQNSNNTVIVVDITPSGNYTMGDFQPGIFIGQLLVIRNASSTNTLTLASNTHVMLSSNIVLLPNQYAMFAWTGTTWISDTQGKVTVSDMQLTSTSATTVASLTPTVQGNYEIKVYYRVVTAATNLTITVTYTDGSGTLQTYSIVNGGSQTVGPYSCVPVLINATPSSPIQVVATAGTSNNVYVSCTIKPE
jgi:hypothetical protein